ncbi:MAG: NAD(P)H-hydrate dehydratase [Gaiellaceae bacterium]
MPEEPQLFEPLYTAAEMRAAEERYPSYPDSIPELMERAGTAVAREAMLAYPDAKRFACVCGGGSNGGDGRVAARVLRDAGREARVIDVSEDADADVGGHDVIVDALFGTGFHGTPRPEAAALIERMTLARAPVVSVDVPSGVDASTGEVVGRAVGAAVTVTFHAPKVGLVVDPGRSFAGRVVVADIGLEDGPTAHARATPALLRKVARRAGRDSKYSAGSVLVIGGQPGMTGAAVLTAMAALRADAGYVQLAVPAESLPVIETLALEPVKLGWTDEDAVEVLTTAASKASAVAIGPGLGRTERRQALVRELLARIERPTVVDADALFGLEPVERSQATVLTPHAGELTRLLGAERGWVDAHRLEAVRTAAERFGAIVLLKGRDTIVAAPPGEGLARFELPSTIVCDHGPPSLATAGTGDVLTGILAAFVTHMDPQLAAVTAAVAHAFAARAVPHQTGLVASDLLDALPAALES